jgi:cytochrome P450
MSEAVLDRLVEPDDLYSEAYFRDPHPFWARLRADQPIFHDTVWDSWILTRYADVEAVFKDHEHYSNATYSTNTGEVFGRTLLEMDGLDHVVRRSIVAPEFVGKRLEAFTEVIDRTARELIEPWRRDGKVDLVDAFTTRLPINVIVDMLALPTADHDRIHDWYTAMMDGLGRTGERETGRAAHDEVCAYVEPYLTERLACPGPDLLSKIAHGHAEGQRLSRSEIESFVSLMLVAGGETTDKAIANLWWNLLSNPDALATVTADPDTLDAAFSESMRKDGPVQFEDRLTTTEADWHGATVPAGARLRVCVASANNDDSVFADPRRFDLDRPDLWLRLEKRSGIHDPDGRHGHLGFGIGKHFCLGYELARTESVLGSRRLLEAMGDPRLLGAPWPTFRGGFRAVTTLPLTFTPS